MGERSVDIQVLGQLRVVVDGVVVPTLPPKERALLELLALTPGRPVRAAALPAGLWGDDPPPSAVKNVQVLVYRLRRRVDDALTTAGGDPLGEALLGTEADAYVLLAPDDAVDLTRFERDLARGRAELAAGDAAAALTCFDAALGAWRGPPLYDLADGEMARGARTRLDELRRAAQEDRFEARLALGQHAEVVGDLEALLQAEPLRERLWAQLMVALYRSGRQADALRAYQRVRTLLGEELGIEPGAELRRLETAVIAHDPALDVAGDRARPAGPAGERAGLLGEIDLDWAGRQRQARLVGRERELERLLRAWDVARKQRRLGIALVSGPPGSGKTRLVAELAHLVRDDGLVVAGAASHDLRSSPFGLALRDLLVAQLDDLPVASDRIHEYLDPLSGAPEPARHERMFVLGEVVVRAAAERPVAFVVDDLHLFDDDGLAVAGAMRDLLQDLPVLFVGSFPTGAERDDPAFAELLRTIDRAPAHDALVLAPLEPDAAARLLADALGPRAQADEAGVAALAAEVGGNPKHLAGLARHLVETGRVDPDGGWVGPPPADLGDAGISDALRTTAGRELDRLPEEVRRVLAAATRVGPSFDLGSAAAAGGLDEDEVLDLLDLAVDQGVLCEQPGRPDGYRFVAGIDRLVLAEQLGKGRRRRVDARLTGHRSGEAGST